jgi:hypothetical protein
MVREIVALCGRRGVGKDFLADALVARFGFVNVKFAAPIKDALRSLFALSADQVEGPAKDEVDERYAASPRRLMQWFGTEVMQHALSRECPGVGRRFWAEKMRMRLEAEDLAGRSVVISDLRFGHELNMLRDHFGARVRVVRMTRPAVAAARLLLPIDADNHESEANVVDLDVDFEIENREDRLDDLVAALMVMRGCPGAGEAGA